MEIKKNDVIIGLTPTPVVYRILEQSDAGVDFGEVERDWDGVIRERMERYDCGQARTRLASEVFAELEKRLGE